jgi:hypothetical protein
MIVAALSLIFKRESRLAALPAGACLIETTTPYSCLGHNQTKSLVAHASSTQNEKFTTESIDRQLQTAEYNPCPPAKDVLIDPRFR